MKLCPNVIHRTIPHETDETKFGTSVEIKQQCARRPRGCHRDAQCPSIDIDQYTLGEEKLQNISVFAGQPVSQMRVFAPDGSGVAPISLQQAKDNRYVRRLHAGRWRGRIYPAGWTPMAIKQRQWSRCESRGLGIWKRQRRPRSATRPKLRIAADPGMALYSTYLGMKYFPDEEKDSQIDQKFQEIYGIIDYNEEGIPQNNPTRIQNHSTTVGILVDKYQAGGTIEDLQKAIKIADYLISRQDPQTGAYQGTKRRLYLCHLSGKVHYGIDGSRSRDDCRWEMMRRIGRPVMTVNTNPSKRRWIIWLNFMEIFIQKDN